MQRALANAVARSTVRAPLLRAARPIPAAALMVPRFASLSGVRMNTTKADQEAAPQEQAAKETNEAGEQTEEATQEDGVVTELKEKLDKKDKDLADMKNLYAKAVADFRNLQDTTKKEMQKSKDFALQKFAKDLLESLDNFELALRSVKEETLNTSEEVKNLYEGVSMTRSVFEKTLTKHGIEKIDPMGEQFDPNHHEATFEIPQPDKEPGTVFHVQQLGYTLNNRVLRPAKVGLVKDPEN